MARLDFKITIWEQWDVPEGVNLKKLKKLVKEGKIADAIELMEKASDDYPTWNYVDGSETYVTTNENKGYSTMELYDHRDEIIAENGESI